MFLKVIGTVIALALVAACQTTRPSQTDSAAAKPVEQSPPQPTVADLQPAEPESAKVPEPDEKIATSVSASSQAEALGQTGQPADAELLFLDFSGFDEDLSREMSEDEEKIVVDVPAAFSLNAVPDRLDKWFAKIKDTGGYVQAREVAREDANRTRGIFGALIDLAVAAYEAQEAEELLEPAGRYNVLIEYDKQSGNADQVIFYRR